MPWGDWIAYAVELGFKRRRATQLVHLFIESAQTEYDFGAFRRWLDPTGEHATDRVLAGQIGGRS